MSSVDDVRIILTLTVNWTMSLSTYINTSIYQYEHANVYSEARWV